jgi:hypothetical protein
VGKPEQAGGDVTDKRPGRAAALVRLPRPAVFLGTLAIALAAFFTPGLAGAVLVSLLAAATAALTAQTWNQRTPGERALRLLVFAVLMAIGISKLW